MGIFKKQKIIFTFEIVILILLTFLVGSSQSSSPFYGDLNLIDEGQFASWLNSMLHGKYMFKDMYIVYGPLYVYPLYLLSKVFSPSAFLVRSYLVAGGAIGIIALNLIMKEIKIRTFARYLMNALLILLPIMHLRQALGWFTIYFLILSVTKKNYLFSFLTGLSIAFTFLVSPELGIITGLITFLYYLYTSINNSKRINIYKSLRYIFLGLIIPTLLFAIWALGEGWFVAYVMTTKKVLLDFSGINVPNGKNIPDIFMLLPFNKPLLAWLKYFISKELLIYYVFLLHVNILLYITIKITLRTITDVDKKIIPITLYALSLLYLLISRPDHFFFILSPILLLSVYFIDKGLEALKQKKLKISQKFSYFLITSILLFFILRVVYINHPQIIKITKIPTAIINTPMNPNRIGPIHISKDQMRVFTDLQNFIDQNTTQNDQIFFFTDEPMMYLILNRDNATKYVLPYAGNLKPMREDMVNDLKKNKPKYIFLDKTAWDVDNINNETRLPEVINYIKENYVVNKEIDKVIIYKIN